MRVTTVRIPLPLEYNEDAMGDRHPIEDSKFVATAEELATHFQGGVTLFKWFAGQMPRGFWWNRGFVGQDVLSLLELVIPDTAANRKWLRKYARDVLLPRFQQRAIYLKFI